MLDQIERYSKAVQTHPTPEIIEAAMEAAQFAGKQFDSAGVVMATARLLSQIHLAKANMRGIGCTAPRPCAEASLVFGWLQNEKGDMYIIPKSIQPCVIAGIKTWPARSSGCQCTHAYQTRKEYFERTSGICADQCFRLQLEQSEVFGDNMRATTGD